jgi:Ring finger domain
MLRHIHQKMVKDEDLLYGKEASKKSEMKKLNYQHSSKTHPSSVGKNDADDEYLECAAATQQTSAPTTTTTTTTTGATRRQRTMSPGDSSEDDITTDDDFDYDDGDDCDIELGRNNTKLRQNQPPSICDEDDEDAHLYLKIPNSHENDDDDETRLSTTTSMTDSCRYVDGECALCIDDYLPGDEVVWSDLQCRHAFHKECIMQWLSKGKKRCPVCRHWFVPGARIEDQKKEREESWKAFLSEMENQNPDNNEQNTDERVNEMTGPIVSDPSISSCIPCINDNKDQDGVEEGTTTCEETSPAILTNISNGDMPLPCRKETDGTERTSRTHIEEDFDSSSSSSSQSYHVDNNSSFGEPNVTQEDHIDPV